MTVTRGGEKRRKQFEWQFDVRLKSVLIRNENGRQHRFLLAEIQSILTTIQARFGDDYFPLANNVEKLSNGTEQLGLGTIILEQEGSDVNLTMLDC